MVFKLDGVYTALVTPFTEDTAEIDYESLGRIIDINIEGGVSGLVPIGTTGESPTLSDEEKERIISFCVSKAKGKCAVIAGTGSNDTSKTVKATKKAKELGVDAVLVVNPYYNRPSQEGLFNHIKSVDAVGVPIVLYNIPGRSGINMTPATIARIYSECENVIGVKEATGSLDQAVEIRSLCDIAIVSGDDALTLPLTAIGGKGVVSVMSNFQPAIMKAMCDKNNLSNGESVLRENYSLIKSMFCEINPVPMKYALYRAGIITSPVVRQPLWPLSDKSKSVVDDCLKARGFLK